MLSKMTPATVPVASRRPFLTVLLLPVLALLLLSPADARAQISWGDSVTHIGDLPKEEREVFEALLSLQGGETDDSGGLGFRRSRSYSFGFGERWTAVPEIGYKYEFFSFFFLELWTWDGKYCLYEDDKYVVLTNADAARLLGVSESKLPVPFLYRFPLGLCILVGGVVLLLLIFLPDMVSGSRSDTTMTEGEVPASQGHGISAGASSRAATSRTPARSAAPPTTRSAALRPTSTSRYSAQRPAVAPKTSSGLRSTGARSAPGVRSPSTTSGPRTSRAEPPSARPSAARRPTGR